MIILHGSLPESLHSMLTAGSDVAMVNINVEPFTIGVSFMNVTGLRGGGGVVGGVVGVVIGTA